MNVAVVEECAVRQKHRCKWPADRVLTRQRSLILRPCALTTLGFASHFMHEARVVRSARVSVCRWIVDWSSIAVGHGQLTMDDPSHCIV